MKLAKLIFSISLLLSSKAFADAPQFVELVSDKSSYVVGEKAVVLASVISAPDNVNSEIYMEAHVGEWNIKLTKLSQDLSAAVTPAIPFAGTFPFAVQVYLQDKVFAAETASSIAAINMEIYSLSQKLAVETDPVKIAYLNQVITKDNSDIASLKSALTASRVLVETQIINLVATVQKVPSKISHPALVLTTDHTDSIFHVGDLATITAHIYPNLIDDSGSPVESFATLTFDGNNIYGAVGETADQFVFKTGIFGSGDLGNHSAVGTLWIRNKKRADQFRGAIDSANQMRLEQITLRDSSEDQYLRAYYQAEIDDLTSIENTCYSALDNMKVSLGDSQILMSVQ